jgi:hypothetical protein
MYKILSSVALIIFVVAFPLYGRIGEDTPGNDCIFVTVKNIDSDDGWNQEIQSFLQDVLSEERKKGRFYFCNPFNVLPSINSTQELKKLIYLLQIDRKKDGSIRFFIKNWSTRRNETDFKSVDWTIEPNEKEIQKKYMKKLLGQFMEFHRNQDQVHVFSLARGVFSSERVRPTSDKHFIETYTGSPISFNEAYDIYVQESLKQKHISRTGLELALLLAGGTAWYWIDYSNKHPEDLVLNWNWESWRKKLTFEAVRFDANSFNINTLHSVGGAYYYLVARSNNWSMLESLLASAAASSVWEYICEYKEIVSINDQILTTIGGMVIGETFFQLSTFFLRSRDTLINRIISALLSPSSQSHMWMDKNRPRVTDGLDSYGFSKDMWHNFQVFAGFGCRSNGGKKKPLFNFDLKTELINFPEYGKPGEVSEFLKDGRSTEMRLSLSVSGNGLDRYLFKAKTSLLGYRLQKTRWDPDTGLQGYSLYIGVTSSLDYSMDREMSSEDLFCVVNILGPSLKLVFYGDRFCVQSSIDVSGNFSLVHSPAFNENYREFTDTVIKRVLLENHYYYALGVTLLPELIIASKKFEIGGWLDFKSFDSIEGLDSIQEEIENDFNLIDRRTGYKIWMNFSLPSDLFKLGLSYEKNYIYSSAGRFIKRNGNSFLMASLLVVF